MVNINVDDVLYLEYDFKYKKVGVHTLTSKFYFPGTLTYLEDGLKNSGYEFLKVDRNVVVHLPKIKRLDKFLKFAYFETDIRSDSPKITVSHSHYKELVRLSMDSGYDIVFA